MTALLIALAVATAAGLLARHRDGRFRTVAPAADLGTATLPSPGERATFVQLSAETCAVCPAVSRVLAGVAAECPGVAHVELRAEEHPDLLRRYDVRRSPTVLLVDGSGRLHSRTSGALTPAQVSAALADLLEESRGHAA
jgi:deoxyinosine 3'endonuclease (endonuclease V)